LIFTFALFRVEITATFDLFAFALCGFDRLPLTLHSFEFAQLPCCVLCFGIEAVCIVNVGLVGALVHLIYIIIPGFLRCSSGLGLPLNLVTDKYVSFFSPKGCRRFCICIGTVYGTAHG